MRGALTIGDYVLATKWSDGLGREPFEIGFYAGHSKDRFLVTDSEGKCMRPSGYRRCEKISKRVGHALVKHIDLIEKSDYSVWFYRRRIKTLEEVANYINGGEFKNEIRI
jgi:hypothetical protein